MLYYFTLQTLHNTVIDDISQVRTRQTDNKDVMDVTLVMGIMNIKDITAIKEIMDITYITRIMDIMYFKDVPAIKDKANTNLRSIMDITDIDDITATV